LYFDPANKEEIKQTILKVLQNPELAKEMVARGHQRLHEFSWDKCARQTLVVLEEAGS
jgi:glycosyltransferase involved in cell wall biosynthesis